MNVLYLICLSKNKIVSQCQNKEIWIKALALFSPIFPNIFILTVLGKWDFSASPQSQIRGLMQYSEIKKSIPSYKSLKISIINYTCIHISRKWQNNKLLHPFVMFALH